MQTEKNVLLFCFNMNRKHKSKTAINTDIFKTIYNNTFYTVYRGETKSEKPGYFGQNVKRRARFNRIFVKITMFILFSGIIYYIIKYTAPPGCGERIHLGEINLLSVVIAAASVFIYTAINWKTYAVYIACIWCNAIIHSWMI